MHDYLRAIGFSQFQSKKEFQKLLEMVIKCPDNTDVAISDKKVPLVEKRRDFARNVGITVRGDRDEDDVFHYEYYYPHYMGRETSLIEDVSIEKLPEREEYDGICEVVNLGVSLIYHLNRINDYSFGMEYESKLPHVNVNLSALSISGTVILPIMKNEKQLLKQAKENESRNVMIAAARQGDQEAIERLTIDDMDLYASISKRVKTEDVLTIVESYFMPYGIACDQYAIMGEIMSCETVYNQLTGEQLYQMMIMCNDILIDLCINAQDLLGEPAEGRRFRGNIWLQGILNEEYLV